MAGTYEPSFILANGDTLIALRNIESFVLSRQEDDAIVDKLKGDLILTCRTVSGLVYNISMKDLLEKFTASNYNIPADIKNLRNSIITKWAILLS